MESFDGGKPVHSARRGAQRDAIASGKRCNAADGPVFPTITRIITLIYLNKMAGSFCPPPASACAYGAGHHCAQPSLLANKSYTVKCFHLSLMCSRSMANAKKCLRPHWLRQRVRAFRQTTRAPYRYGQRINPRSQPGV